MKERAYELRKGQIINNLKLEYIKIMTHIYNIYAKNDQCNKMTSARRFGHFLRIVGR